MRKFAVLLAAALLAAMTPGAAHAVQCVAYAREISGIRLSGDAWQWWNNAAGAYDRGSAPRPGAVLVFSRQGHMRHGHVAVVTEMIDPRVVLVDHANWAPVHAAGRGKVSRAVRVLDVSPDNDWTQVRVWFGPTDQYGDRVYQTKGFVYARPNDAARVETVAATLPADDATDDDTPAPRALKAGHHKAAHAKALHHAAHGHDRHIAHRAPHRPQQVARHHSGTGQG